MCVFNFEVKSAFKYAFMHASVFKKKGFMSSKLCLRLIYVIYSSHQGHKYARPYSLEDSLSFPVPSPSISCSL